MLEFDKESGFYHDPETGHVYVDEMMKEVIDVYPLTVSLEYVKLFLLSLKFKDDPKEYNKINKKMTTQSVQDLPYIISSPEYCYAYVLYKIRKLSGLNQEGMAFSIGMSKSTYNKIENRVLSLSLNNIHMVINIFRISLLEFSQLYLNVERIILNSGNFFIPSKISNFNTDNEVYIDNSIPDIYRTTPIHLYDKKISPDILTELDISFQEILLEGKKRQAKEEQNK